MEKNKLLIPTEIRTILNANLDNFSASLYVEENPIDIDNFFEQKIRTDFSYYKYNFSHRRIIESKGVMLYTFNVEKIPANPDFEPLKGLFFLIKDSINKIIFVISPENKKYLSRVVHSFMEDYFYTKISRVYITSKEIFEILEIIENKIKQPILSNWCTGTRLFSEHPDKIIRWGDKLISFRECFDLAKKEKMSINWIRSEAYDDEGYQKIKLDISRDCNLVSNLKWINEIYEALNIIITKGKEDLNLLSNKEIKEDSPARPILLSYPEKVLSNKELKEKFLETIDKYNRCNYSVIHGGNPHIYMYIKDSIDTSSFSLRSVGSNKILIIPQLKSTYAALMRFIHFLNENFTEYNKLNEVIPPMESTQNG